jgi:hypothetical protein
MKVRLLFLGRGLFPRRLRFSACEEIRECRIALNDT